MLRPQSIVIFERCYLGAWIVGLLNTLANWNATLATVNANPASAQLGPSFAVTMLIGGLAIGAAVTLLLWYFVARRGSAIAKWVVTVFFALGLVFFLLGLARTGLGGGLTAVIGVVQIVLQGIAVAMLFRPDTKAWFGETVTDPVV